MRNSSSSEPARLVDAVTWRWKRPEGAAPRTSSAAVWTCPGIGRQRRPADADGEVAAYMRHQVAAHQRRRKRVQRQPCALHAAGSQDHRAALLDPQRHSLPGDIDLDGVDDAVGCVQLDDVGQRDQEEPAVGVAAVLSRARPRGQRRSAAASCCTCRS